jgi:hypothetical protein
MDVVTAYFKVLCQHLSEETQKEHKNLNVGVLGCYAM